MIQYDFQKEELRDLRLYIVSLEKYKNLYEVDEQIIFKKDQQINLYKTVIDNQSDVIKFNEDINSELSNINDKLTTQVDKYRKRSKKWPCYLGAGFIGGIITCQLIK